MNRQQRRAAARSGVDGAAEVWYGLCTFWTATWDTLSRTPNGIPCCPHCGSPGFQTSLENWDPARFEAEGNEGYGAFLESLREVCHGRGVTTMGLWRERQATS